MTSKNSWIKPLFSLYLSQKITAPECTAAYLIIMSAEKYGSRWKASPIRPPLSFNHHPSAVHWSQYPSEISSAALVGPESGLWELSPLETLNHFCIWKTSSEANLALLLWAQSERRMVLTSLVPSAHEMLELQRTGRRYVTAVADPAKLWSQIEHKPDALSFLIHDLEHAYHFFIDPEVYFGQVQFFKLLHKAYREGLFEDLLGDPVFSKDYEYLIADMNSHSVHMFQYLKSKRIEHELRREDKTLKDKLSWAGQLRLQKWFEDLYRSWEVTSASALDALRRSNTARFRGDTDRITLAKYFRSRPFSPLQLTFKDT